MPQASGNETQIDNSKQRGHRPLPTVEFWGFRNMVYEAGRVLQKVYQTLADLPTTAEWGSLIPLAKKALAEKLGKLISYAKQANRAFGFAHDLGVKVEQGALVLAKQAMAIKIKPKENKDTVTKEMFPWEAKHFGIIDAELKRLDEEVRRVEAGVSQAGKEGLESFPVKDVFKPGAELDDEAVKAMEDADKALLPRIFKR